MNGGDAEIRTLGGATRGRFGCIGAEGIWVQPIYILCDPLAKVSLDSNLYGDSSAVTITHAPLDFFLLIPGDRCEKKMALQANLPWTKATSSSTR